MKIEGVVMAMISEYPFKFQCFGYNSIDDQFDVTTGFIYHKSTCPDFYTLSVVHSIHVAGIWRRGTNATRAWEQTKGQLIRWFAIFSQIKKSCKFQYGVGFLKSILYVLTGDYE